MEPLNKETFSADLEAIRNPTDDVYGSRCSGSYRTPNRTPKRPKKSAPTEPSRR